MKMAISSADRSCSIPLACHGSMDPLGKITLEAFIPPPPYLVRVQFTPCEMVSKVNCLPKMSAHCWTQKLERKDRVYQGYIICI